MRKQLASVLDGEVSLPMPVGDIFDIELGEDQDHSLSQKDMRKSEVVNLQELLPKFGLLHGLLLKSCIVSLHHSLHILCTHTGDQ